MLLITFYDPKQEYAIWNGYASGVVGANRIENKLFLQHIVQKVLHKYRVLAYDFKTM
jgi:hypothetical protein